MTPLELPAPPLAGGSLWQGAAAPQASLLLSVVVPVRNEAAGLAATLASIARQRSLDDSAFDLTCVEILVLANNCSDDSASIARSFAKANPALALHVEEVHLAPADAHIGHVRRVLMDAACSRLERTGRDGFVVSTDGDTLAEAHWLASTLQEFKSGADVVGGRILLDPRASLDAATLRHQRCDTAHRLAQSRLEDMLDPDPADPWPRHHQHFGASLALRASAYRHVGGIPQVRFLEDEALVDACRRADLRIRHSPHVRVRTSPRREGRVEVGLSWQLRQWSERGNDAESMGVEDPEVFVARVKRRRLLREAWSTGGRSAMTLGTFGAAWADSESAMSAAQSAPQVPMRQAIDRLKTMIQRHPADSLARSKTSSR